MAAAVLATYPTEAVNGTTTNDDNEVIMHVPVDVANVSLGFAFDMGMMTKVQSSNGITHNYPKLR